MSQVMRLEKCYTMMGNNFSTHGLNVELWPKYDWKLNKKNLSEQSHGKSQTNFRKVWIWTHFPTLSPTLSSPSDDPPPSPEPPRHACAPRRRPERPSGPLRPASAPSAAATRVHRSRAAVMTGTPHGPTAPTRVATAVRSRVAPPPHPRFDPLRLTAPHNLLCTL